MVQWRGLGQGSLEVKQLLLFQLFGVNIFLYEIEKY